MSFTRLDPYNHLIRQLSSDSNLADLDRKHVLSMVNAYKKQSTITLDQAAFVCAGLLSYAQSLRIRALLRRTDLKSGQYRQLTWSYAKHLETYRKVFSVLGKVKGPESRAKRGRRTEGKPALWSPKNPLATEPPVNAETA